MTGCSVVLASYQGERFIGAQIDSILVQLGPEDEIIISDDASSDTTLNVVRRRNDARIRILANRDRVGYVRNFQRAIEQVRGNTVFFSDQDDVWLPEKVSTLRKALLKKPFAASDAIIVDENLVELHHSYFDWRNTRSFSWQSMFLRPAIVGATMACTTDYLRSLLPLPAQVPHDFWLSFNASWDGAMEIVSAPLILYRRHAAASSPSGTKRKRSMSRIAGERCLLALTMATNRLRLTTK